jgi:hypothetical protein
MNTTEYGMQNWTSRCAWAEFASDGYMNPKIATYDAE